MLALYALAALADPVTVRMVEHLGEPYVVVTVDLREASLDLYGASPGDAQTFASLAKRLEKDGQTLLVATNAGMYTPSYEPVGLAVERGVERRAANRSDGDGNFFLKPNGVFWLDEEGAHVAATGDYAPQGRSIRLATQSGPILLANGAVHPAFRPESPNRNIRSGVGVQDAHTVHLVISEGGVRFHDLATLFRDELGCADALYLDGLVSTLRAPGLPEPVERRYGGILAVTVPTGP